MLYLLCVQGQSSSDLCSSQGVKREQSRDGNFFGLPDVPKSQLRQVRQLLNLDDGVVERRLQTLSHHVGQDDRHHHGQDVGDLACQLKADNRRGHSVSHSPGQCRRSYQRCRTG